jgi:hypothetical protein
MLPVPHCSAGGKELAYISILSKIQLQEFVWLARNVMCYDQVWSTASSIHTLNILLI